MDWDKSWEKISSTINEQDVWLLTDRIKFQYLSKLVPKGARSLEVGCGSAKLSILLAQYGVHVVGLDLSIEALKVAKRNFALVKAQGGLVHGDAFQLPFADEQFNIVFSTGLLEHFRDPVPLVTEMVRVLRPGGLFFSDVAPLKFSLLRMGYYLRGYHRHERNEYHYTARDIKEWLEKSGLKDVRVLPSGIVPPLGLLRRSPFLRTLAFRVERLWSVLDGTFVAERLGFFYLAFATKGK